MQANFYPINKSRFVLMLVFFVLLAIGSLTGIYYIYTHPNDDGYVYMPRIVIALPILGVLGIIFALLNIFSGKKGVTISTAGLALNYGLNKFGPIAWTDIVSANKKRYLMNNYLVVYLKDPAAFVATRKGFNKRMYNENWSAHGSPLVINATQLTGDMDTILAEIKSRITVSA